ncbi:hypothetical protein L207DRAFT_513042 [Hyaloscypha variabilis F]|uniref:Uncharacterized protein n=1 Tax=Hyaloscypha variabilis (strain UAMH 11265 / GT02V1 / F) TaxID=1149755 RepID=A0A2J6RNJ6_HYAVF|nr:hypothetical protein L207DRAFT_513042 [Hyaloscypha variabilis F]
MKLIAISFWTSLTKDLLQADKCGSAPNQSQNGVHVAAKRLPAPGSQVPSRTVRTAHASEGWHTLQINGSF